MGEQYIKKLSEIKKDIGIIQDSIFLELCTLVETNRKQAIMLAKIDVIVNDTYKDPTIGEKYLLNKIREIKVVLGGQKKVKKLIKTFKEALNEQNRKGN